MDSAIQVLERMESVLDQLISNAEALKDISMEGFSEQAITPLQQKQELLVEQLNGLEANFEGSEKEGQEEILAKIGDRIAKKLRYFQHLNAVFIENINEGNFMEDYWKSNPEVPDIGLPHRRKNEESNE
ncbi:MAG: hypothetical protein BGO14_04600 [Chlamydiales bacterium 38-26]|nr:hypothetical protein [Chlamydiales bacterium]OJV07772.1 MAG: hypothetical protein BGO14_04600 [Chlamydiales bacterium 38-26]